MSDYPNPRNWIEAMDTAAQMLLDDADATPEDNPNRDDYIAQAKREAAAIRNLIDRIEDNEL
ncbi:MAG: hypothetical protein AAGG38_02105 [Planctomycetota bacterium]